MVEKFLLLKDSIYSFSKGESIIYVANGGNWGDALIRAGTIKYFQENCIEFIEIPFWNIFSNESIKSKTIIRFLEGKTLVFGGGGAWNKTYSTGWTFIRLFQKYFNKVIVLPSTYEIPFKSSNTICFCRDSYQSKKAIPDAVFCHDMAFYLKCLPSVNKNKKETGYFFRTDAESTKKWKIPLDNLDLSLLGNEQTPINQFLSTIDQFNEVHTDRLHVAIGAILLGKTLKFYSGNYFKNEAVYKSSIHDFFEDVKFVK